MLRAALAEQLIAVDPAAKLRPLQARKNKRGTFTAAQIGQLLFVAPAEWRSIIICAVYTGQRLGDVAALKWADIDRDKNQIVLQTIKTKRHLVIPLAAPLASHLETVLELGPHVHPHAAKTRVAALSRQFYRLVSRAGLATASPSPRSGRGHGRRHGANKCRALCFHSLRHTATSWLAGAGIPQSVVMEFIGHSSAAVSRGYTHTDLTALRSAAAALPSITCRSSSMQLELSL